MVPFIDYSFMNGMNGMNGRFYIRRRNKWWKENVTE